MSNYRQQVEAVKCPYCHVAAGKPCVTVNGFPSRTHAKRRQAYFRKERL